MDARKVVAVWWHVAGGLALAGVGCLGAKPIDLGRGNDSADVPTSANDETTTNTSGTGGTSESNEVSDVVGDAGDSAPPNCSAAWPDDVDFGAVSAGTCATRAVHIAMECGASTATLTATLEGGSDSAFSVTAESEPATGGHASRLVTIIYCPTQSNTAATGTLALVVAPADGTASDPRATTHAVSLGGHAPGLLAPCPTFAIAEGTTVEPQTRLHLVGSTTGTLAISQYQWRVDAPSGVVDHFRPSSTLADPTYEANIVGDYTFHLVLTDFAGNSCEAAPQTVHVVTTQAIHIELLWHTPGDLDESDEGPTAGADLDLHFAHPFATGSDLDGDGIGDPFFHDVFDCFFSNDHPNWGSLDPSVDDSPHLDRDDTDGGGPENINLNRPENVCYTVGVYVWDEHGFGPSDATVRIYLSGVRVFEAANVRLAARDLWTVTRLCWPDLGPPTLARACSGTTNACNSDADCAAGVPCGLRIAHAYVNTSFPPP